VLGNNATERRDVLERAAHKQRVVYAVAVVREDTNGGAGLGHCPDLGEPLPRESCRDGADRAHRDVAVAASERLDLFDDASRVLHGQRVGHRKDRSESADRSSTGSGQNRLALFEARFAQVGVKVDEAGKCDKAVGVDDC